MTEEQTNQRIHDNSPMPVEFEGQKFDSRRKFVEHYSIVLGVSTAMVQTTLYKHGWDIPKAMEELRGSSARRQMNGPTDHDTRDDQDARIEAIIAGLQSIGDAVNNSRSAELTWQAKYEELQTENEKLNGKIIEDNARYEKISKQQERMLMAMERLLNVTHQHLNEHNAPHLTRRNMIG